MTPHLYASLVENPKDLDSLFLFSHSVVSNSLWRRGLQHIKLACPLLSPGVCSNSCSLNWRCHLTTSSSVAPFSSCSFPAKSRSFPMSLLYTADDQSTRDSASTSALLMHSQGWFPLGLTGLITLQSKRLSRAFSSTTAQKYHVFGAQPSLWSNFPICTWLLEKPYLWLYGGLSEKWCLCFLICCLGWSYLFFQRARVL